MPSLTLDDRLIWFAHCPKAGGTSVEKVMVARWGDAVGHLHWGWDLWWRRGGWRVANPPNSPQHLTWADAAAVLPRPPDAVFTLVRDPAARMVSEYRWQRTHRRGTRAGRWLARLPFPLWLRLMLAVARRNPFAFDNHFRPQTEFVPEGAVVLRLEDGLQRALDWLAETVGSGPAPASPHALKSPPAPVVLGPAEAARIAAVFDPDYARFGYCRPPVPAPRADTLDRLAAVLAPTVAWLDRCGHRTVPPPGVNPFPAPFRRCPIAAKRNAAMALISDATTAWSSPITLTQDEIWQTRRGGVFVTTTVSPATDDGLFLREGTGIRLSAGSDVRYRKEGTGEAVVACEAV